MPSGVPSLEAEAVATEDTVSNLAKGLLLSFFATHGEGCEQRFQNDTGFRQLLWDQCIHTLGVVAAVMSWWDESLTHQGIAADTIANAAQDSQDVAALRIFTFKNMIPNESLEQPEIASRVQWFLDEYQKNRGQPMITPGH